MGEAVQRPGLSSKGQVGKEGEGQGGGGGGVYSGVY